MPDPGGYTWDAGLGRYRDRRGRLVSAADVRSALDAVVDAAQADMVAASEQLQRGEIEVGDWQARMEWGLKLSHTAAAAAAKGGWAQVGPADWSLVAVRLRGQYRYLRNFAYQVANGLPLDGSFLVRAGMYGNSAIGTYEKVKRVDDLAAGFTEERRVLHSRESCPSCIRYAGLGWQPAGMLPDIGTASECLTNDRCTFERRKRVAARAEKLTRSPVETPPPAPPLSAPKPPPRPKAPNVAGSATLAGVAEAKERAYREGRGIGGAIDAYIAAHREPGTLAVRAHGMPEPEEMESIHLGGTTYRWPATAAGRAAFREFLSAASRPGEAVPEALARHTRQVILTSQRSRDEAYWAEKYGISGASIAATGGDGNIVNYGGGGRNWTLAHEMAHNLATARYGATDPPPGSDFARAAASGESPPTDYGRKAIAEDFADSVDLFVKDPEALRRLAPRRFEVIRRLLAEPDYAG